MQALRLTSYPHFPPGSDSPERSTRGQYVLSPHGPTSSGTMLLPRMSRVTKTYKGETRRSNLINKEKRGVPSQKSSDRTSDRSSKSATSPPEGDSCSESDAGLQSKLSDSSSQNFSTTLGTVGDSPGPVAHKRWNVGLGDSSMSVYSPPNSPIGLFCKTPIEHPVDSNGRPTLRIMIPTSPTSNRRKDELPHAPSISNDNSKHPWDHKHDS